MFPDRIVAAIFALGLAGVALFFFHSWLLFGIVGCGILVLCLALGFGAVHRTLLFLFAGYVLLLGGMAWLGHTARLVLGFPASTALLVYGIWPLPLIAGLLYALVFRSSVLPEDKLEKFLADHSRRSGG